MCPQRVISDQEREKSTREELSTKRYFALIDELAKMGTRRIHIVGGGEPLLRKDTLDLMRRVKAYGLEGILTTNGTLLDEQKIRELIKLSWDLVMFSVDGPSPEVYEEIRGVSGAFKKVVSNMKKLSQLRAEHRQVYPLIQIHCVIMNTNYALLEDMIELAREVNADIVTFVKCRPQDLSLPVSKKNLPETFQHLKEAIKRAKKYGITMNASELLLLWSKKPENTICFRPWISPDIWHNGDVTPCCYSREVMGNIKNRSFREVWDGEKFNNLRKIFLQGSYPDFCKDCNWPELLQYTVPLGKWLHTPKTLITLPKFGHRNREKAGIICSE
jgi:MoaA/NifB/PqqE/SkfB family radical SAM enzyme